jgi:hypothetical protein
VWRALSIVAVAGCAARSGALLAGDHVERFRVLADAPTAVYTPLPIDFATQVPLYVELTVTPPEVVDHIEYTTEPEHDWGAKVFLRSTDRDVTLAWRAVVMTRTVSDAERPTAFAASSPPDRWLRATRIADASDPTIARVARIVGHEGESPSDRMQATLRFVTQYLHSTTVHGLSATTVFATRSATCTGYANAAAALGRALGVPTRHITNILVGAPQQLHSIDEFYLGPELGWRRVEPQRTATTLRDDYGMILRIVLPEDEGADALAAHDGSLPGVPLHEFSEPVDGSTRLRRAVSSHFTGCPSCISRAERQAVFRGDPVHVAATFARARARWQIDLAKYRAGVLDPATMTARRAFLTARSLADVDAILAALP